MDGISLENFGLCWFLEIFRDLIIDETQDEPEKL